MYVVMIERKKKLQKKKNKKKKRLDWIRATNFINQKYNKYFQFNVTVVLNHEDIKKDCKE